MKIGELFLYHSYCPKCDITLTHWSRFYDDRGKRIYNLGGCMKCGKMMKLKKDQLVTGINKNK